jgi:pyrroloquinoline quinone biosynthesis protein B
LINASPDLSHQIESTPALQPSGKNARNTPIAGVLLTNADIDHAFGLVMLRQQKEPIVVYASEATRNALQWLNAVLQRFCGIEWRDLNHASLGTNLLVRVIELQESTALHISDKASHAKVLIAPAVAAVSDELRDAARNSDVVFFDGTFWTDNELQQVRPDARSAKEMRHLPINNGSLEFLQPLSAKRFYIHINNTNPILMPNSPERVRLEAVGIEIAYDGLELTL